MTAPGTGKAPNASVLALAGLLTASAINHFTTPHFYYSVVPPSITSRKVSRRDWVHASGVIEFAGAAGLLLPQTRRTAAACTAFMFAGFTAGHVSALQRAYGPKGSRKARVIHSLRLPLQLPLVAWAWNARNG